MLGDGRRVDLYKLFMVVRGKGGYDAVCDSKLWDLVAEESGLDLSVGSSVKLVYSKYLSALDTWLKKVGGGADSKVPAECGLVDDRAKFGRRLMELHDEMVAGLLEDYTNENNEAGGGGGSEEFKSELDDGREVSGGNGVEGVSLEASGDEGVQNGGHRDMEMMKCTVNESILDESILGEFCGADDAMDVLDGKFCEGGDAMEVVEEFGRGKVPAEVGNGMPGLLGGAKKFNDGDGGVLVLDRSGGDKEGSSRKRKRDSMSDLLTWVTGVALNPCDPEVGSIPEKLKWKAYGPEVVWKQVLLLREAAFLKRSFESSSEQQYWQVI